MTILLRCGALGLPLLLIIGACASRGPARTPTGARASCSSDDDCIVTDFAGCCPCCKIEPYAAPRGDAARRKNACAATECTACDPNVVCPKVVGRVADLVAKCKDGTCAAVAR
jgi:hypothetical protein